MTLSYYTVTERSSVGLEVGRRSSRESESSRPEGVLISEFVSPVRLLPLYIRCVLVIYMTREY